MYVKAFEECMSPHTPFTHLLIEFYGKHNFPLILKPLKSYLKPLPNILWMPAGQFSMGHNSVNEKQRSQKYFKALLSAGYF